MNWETEHTPPPVSQPGITPSFKPMSLNSTADFARPAAWPLPPQHCPRAKRLKKTATQAAHPQVNQVRHVRGETLHRREVQAREEIGYDGVELNSPGGVNKDEALAASHETGFPIHGVVDSIHRGTRLSSPDKATRRKGLEGLKTAIRDTSKAASCCSSSVPFAMPKTKSPNMWDCPSNKFI